MSGVSSPTCPRCGARVPATARDRLCPACLITAALLEPDPEVTRPDPAGARSRGRSEGLPRDLGGYRLLSFLGRGGMGTVYEAEQVATGRRVALKVLARDLDSPEMRLRFLREGRIAAGISHPNSLYVFGTEEIDGHPVIAMEIASGGTLADRLEARGPLPVAEAVDAILDVVSGLETALAVGVLHRDVKPSNCFVGMDGTIKIGDFGLSVSRMVPEDPELAGSGAVLGTPAYASPEQVRGGELDVRSDIYSVGGTLFALLSGRPPVEGRSVAEVLAAKLDAKPPSLTDLRDDVPVGLAAVVARCLAKQPERRFPGYADLRRALLPFSSIQPEPAPLGRRFFAGFLDAAASAILPAIAIHAFWGIELDDRLLFTERSDVQVISWIGLAGLVVAYHAIAEGLWGAGLGKALMGLRVSATGGRHPGFGRAAVRALVFALAGNVGKAACFVMMSAEHYLAGGMVLVGIGNPLIMLGFFATMRRDNGFASVWDLATRTRVVVRSKVTARPEVEVRTPPEPVASAARLGPFAVVAEVVPTRWVEAWDPVLRRTVWLLRRAGDGCATRRDVARPGRARWLQATTVGDTSWEVFEAPVGVPLRRLVRAGDGVPWESMRYWLRDLAAEVAAATRDGTLPTLLSLDQVWVTAGGRAVLLDEPWPDPEPSAPMTESSERDPFLRSIAARVDLTTVPLHARSVLHELATGGVNSPDALVDRLDTVLFRPGRVDRQIRAASLFAVPLFVAAFAALIVAGYAVTGRLTAAELRDPEAIKASIAAPLALASVLAGTQLLSLVAARMTLGQVVFGFAVVDDLGCPAGRGRLVARWLISWILPLAVAAWFLGVAETDPAGPELLPLLALLPWFAGLGVAVARPHRGLHDRWSGCWLVPR